MLLCGTVLWAALFAALLAASLLLPAVLHPRPRHIRFVVTVNGRAQFVQHDEAVDAPGAVPRAFCAAHSIEPRAACEQHVRVEIERRVRARADADRLSALPPRWADATNASWWAEAAAAYLTTTHVDVMDSRADADRLEVVRFAVAADDGALHARARSFIEEVGAPAADIAPLLRRMGEQQAAVRSRRGKVAAHAALLLIVIACAGAFARCCRDRDGDSDSAQMRPPHEGGHEAAAPRLRRYAFGTVQLCAAYAVHWHHSVVFTGAATTGAGAAPDGDGSSGRGSGSVGAQSRLATCAVTCLFGLSGFLGALSLSRSSGSGSGSGRDPGSRSRGRAAAALAFTARRVSRLYPTFVLQVALAAVELGWRSAKKRVPPCREAFRSRCSPRRVPSVRQSWLLSSHAPQNCWA